MDDLDRAERSGIGLALLIGAVGFFVVLWLAVDACNDDPNERDNLGAPAWVAHHEDCDGGYCAGEDNRGDCRNTDQPCEDNDFSPSFDKSPVEGQLQPRPDLPARLHLQLRRTTEGGVMFVPHGPLGELAKTIAMTVCNFVVSIFDLFPI